VIVLQISREVTRLLAKPKPEPVVIANKPETYHVTPPPLPPISNNVETKKIMVHTTLIRDSRGLGFSIAGGQGSQPFKVSPNFV